MGGLLGVPHFGSSDPGALDADRTLLARLLEIVGVAPGAESVQRHGARAGEDATAAIAAAIAAAELSGRPVWIDPLPPGEFYDVSGSGSAIFTLTRPVWILGAGMRSVLRVMTGTPTSRDVFLYDPIDNGEATSFPLFRGFRIQGQTAGVGRYGLHFNPGGAGEFVRRFGVEKMWFQNLGNFAVYADASSTAGIFISWIKECWIDGPGFGALDLFDSVLVDNCTVTGSGYAVDVDWTSGGPGQFIVRGCNISSASGLRFGGPIAGLWVHHNYIETQATYTGANDALLDLNGASSAVIECPAVVSNIFTVLGGLGDPDGMRLNYTLDAYVEANRFSTPSGTYGCNITANATDSFFGPSNRQKGAGTLFNNAGTGSKTVSLVNL